jgi:hypothetical protein
MSIPGCLADARTYASRINHPFLLFAAKCNPESGYPDIGAVWQLTSVLNEWLRNFVSILKTLVPRNLKAMSNLKHLSDGLSKVWKPAKAHKAFYRGGKVAVHFYFGLFFCGSSVKVVESLLLCRRLKYPPTILWWSRSTMKKLPSWT